MQEPVHSLIYILEHIDIMRNWVDIEVEMLSGVICMAKTVKVWVTFCGIVQLIHIAVQSS